MSLNRYSSLFAAVPRSSAAIASRLVIGGELLNDDAVHDDFGLIHIARLIRPQILGAIRARDNLNRRMRWQPIDHRLRAGFCLLQSRGRSFARIHAARDIDEQNRVDRVAAAARSAR
jgi:hypothetical protein